jgi:hypothetical protein
MYGQSGNTKDKFHFSNKLGTSICYRHLLAMIDKRLVMRHVQLVSDVEKMFSITSTNPSDISVVVVSKSGKVYQEFACQDRLEVQNRKAYRSR